MIRKIYGRKEFREDVFKIMQEAAFKNKEIVFMLSESQIIHEVFLEDINNILNSGEVPNIWDMVRARSILLHKVFLCWGTML